MLYGRDKQAPVLYKGSYNAAYLNPYICNYCDSQGYTHKTSGPEYGYIGGSSGGYTGGHGGYIGVGAQRAYTGAQGAYTTGGHGGYAGAQGGYTTGGHGGYTGAQGGYTGAKVGYTTGGRGGYSGSHSHGYKAPQPQVVGTYQKSSTKKVTKVNHDKQVKEGSQKGTYVRTTVEPAKVVGY